MAVKIYLILVSAYMIVIAAVPRFLVKKGMDFAGNEMLRRRYILHQRINAFAAGAVMLVGLFLPPKLMDIFVLPLLAVIFVSVLCCNKSNLGRWTAWKKS